jgi:hypothetical protein
VSSKEEEIISAIRSAFSHVQRGQSISLHETDAIDDYADDNQRKKARLLDTDVHWWEIAPEQLEKFYSALFYMDAEGFRYYIPAYMTQALRTYKVGSSSVDAALSSLFPLTGDASELYALLDDPQKKCVAQFLWFIATETGDQWKDKLEVYNATRALEDFWYPYLS